jgi:hypothetical protein
VRRPTFDPEKAGGGKPFGANVPVPLARAAFALALPLVPVAHLAHAAWVAMVAEPVWIEEIQILFRAVFGIWTSEDANFYGTREEAEAWLRRARITGHLVQTGRGRRGRIQWRVQR